MFVYLFADYDSHAIKIGMSKNPSKRIKKINSCQNHFNFEILFYKQFERRTALECERRILFKMSNRYQHFKEQFDGNTEVFVINERFNEAIMFVMWLINDYESYVERKHEAWLTSFWEMQAEYEKEYELQQEAHAIFYREYQKGMKKD